MTLSVHEMPFGSGILIRVRLTTTHFSMYECQKSMQWIWGRVKQCTAPHSVHENHQNHWHLPPLSPQRTCRNNRFAGSYRYILEAFAYAHMWKTPTKLKQQSAHPFLCCCMRACACERENFFCVGSDTDTVIHTKLNSVTSEAYLIKSCGKFSVEFVSYFRTFRSSVHFIPCVPTSNSSLGMFVGLFTFVVCHFLCVKTQAQRKTYNSSMWFTFMRIKWTERKTFFPTISSE